MVIPQKRDASGGADDVSAGTGRQRQGGAAGGGGGGKQRGSQGFTSVFEAQASGGMKGEERCNGKDGIGRHGWLSGDGGGSQGAEKQVDEGQCEGCVGSWMRLWWV